MMWDNVALRADTRQQNIVTPLSHTTDQPRIHKSLRFCSSAGAPLMKKVFCCPACKHAAAEGFFSWLICCDDIVEPDALLYKDKADRTLNDVEQLAEEIERYDRQRGKTA